MASLSHAQNPSEISRTEINEIFQDEKQDSTKVEWSLGLEGRNFEEGTERVVGTKTSLNVRAHYILSPHLSIDGDVSFRWFSDNAQLDLSEDYSTRPVGAREIAINYRPFQWVNFSFGNISQEFLNANLLVTSRAFPGLRQKLNWQGDFFDIGLVTQQTVPTAQSFNIDRTEREKLPWFFTETLYAEYDFNRWFQIGWINEMKFRLAGTYFQFNDLPAVTAEDGTRLGHIPKEGTVGPNAQFRYDFEGYMIDPSICFCGANETGMTLGGLWIDNLQAKNNDRAQSLYLRANAIWNELRFGVGYETYFKDSEVSPAVYGDLKTGANNREGNVYSLRLESMKYKFTVVADYYDIGVISGAGILQNDRKAIYIGLETAYVEF